MTTTQMTLAGVAISLAILALNLRTWWRGGRQLKDLWPFAQTFLLGGIATICAGGILGWLAGCTAQGINTAGEKVVPGTTGTGSGAIAYGSLGDLSPEGGVVVFLLTVLTVAGWKAAGKQEQRRAIGGAICGATLCLTAGVAGLMDWLPDAINAVGMWGRGALEGSVL